MKRQNTCCSPVGRHLPRGVSRRDILRFSMAGMGLVALGPLGGALREARGAPATQNFLVVLNLFGGNDGLNTVIPRTLANYYSRRPGLAIPAGDELSLDAGPAATTQYGLHPTLQNIQSLWNDGDVAIVNLVGYPQANLSHFTSMDIYSLAVRGAFADLGLSESGWIARFADLYAPTPLGAVSVGVGRPLDFEGGTSSPFLVNSLASFRFLGDPRYPDNHLHRLEAIQEVLDDFSGTGITTEVAEALRQGHDLSGQIQDAVASYSSSVVYQATNGRVYNIHRYMQDIARLVQYGFETQIFYTGFGGYDTHANQGQDTGRHADLLDRLDTSVGAFAQDMKDMGVWNQTAIAVITEFGRRNFKNGSDGTDHGHGNAFLVIGGAVNGGVYARDITEDDVDEAWLPYDVDFRDIYREVLDDHLGADPAPVFPESQPTSHDLGLI